MNSSCIILAAGQGRRLGGRNKALLSLGAESFLERIASRCRQMAIDELAVVVAAPHLEETKREAERLQLGCIENPRPERGMASSVAVGFSHALDRFAASHAWLWPVDSPGAKLETLQALSEEVAEAAIIIPTFQGRGGHPALVARSVWAELAVCSEAAEGARTVFRRDPTRVLRLPVADPAVLVDVDLDGDIERLP